MSDPRLPDLFADASELAADERAVWLEALRKDDPSLAGEVEALLAAAPTVERRFDTPAWAQLSADDEPAPPAPLPERIGPYRIVREIGRGGMGRVFLAEQEGDEFRRTVALKVIDRPGAEPDAVRRFRDEVRILASLEHPGIARFFDGGRAPDGTWFLALEYVEGEDLLSYVRRRALDLRARVELFLQVLDAVDYAHRRLVVHRDLKPQNVLVDSAGRARLLDFGISKIVDPGAELDGGLTQTRAFTPDYASPEQLRGARSTVATDVYSLGVMLYEMLAGRRPFTRTESELELPSPPRDPEPPSTAVRRTTAPSEAAAAREVTTAVAWRDLTGDLDAITLKALRAEPESRYPSAEAFANDLRRFLAGKPVEARRGGRRYRVGKFVRRHRAEVVFAAAGVLILVAGVAGIVVQSRRASRAAALASEQRDFAMRELSRAEAVNELNAFLLSDAAPGGRAFTTSDLLARAEEILARQRGDADENRAELLIAIGSQYHAQDEEVRSRRVLTEAYDLTRRSPDPGTRAKAACALAVAFARAADPVRAERLVKEGLGQLPDAPQFTLHRVFCLVRAADVARRAQEGALAIARSEEADRLLRESGQGSALLDLRVATSLAHSYRIGGRLPEANEAYEHAWRRLKELGRDATGSAVNLLNTWGMNMRGLGRPREAEPLFRRAVEISSADGSTEGVGPNLFMNLGTTLLDLERLDEAGRYLNLAYAEARRTGNETAMTIALARKNILYIRLGDLPRAASSLAELEPRIPRLPGKVFRAILASQQAMLAEARGDERTARALHDRAVAGSREEDLISFTVMLGRRSAFELANGRPDAAWSDAERALAAAQQRTEPGTFSCHVGWAHLALAQALQAQGKTAEARAAAAAALAHLEPTVGTDHPDTRAAASLAK